MTQHGGEELRPFRRPACIGDIAGDQDMVERLLRMNLLEPVQQPPEPLVAARTEASAFQPEAETLADDMNVGQMHDPP